MWHRIYQPLSAVQACATRTLGFCSGLMLLLLLLSGPSVAVSMVGETSDVANAATSANNKANIDALNRLAKHHWYAGAADCKAATAQKAAMQAPIEVFRFNAGTYILRQNKCVHYEAPFMYLLMGTEGALLLDSGATKTPDSFPLQQQVARLMQDYYQKPMPLLVAHSHSHGDHVAADEQFAKQAQTRVLARNVEALQTAFNMASWPEVQGRYELGNRPLTVLAIPGHQTESIAIFDPQTGLLLTGDTLYPGRLYVRNWQAFRDSINRLNQFVEQHPVQAILGAHIEMDNQGSDYPVGTQYQPKEHSLLIAPEALPPLNLLLQGHPQPTPLKSGLTFKVVPLDLRRS